MPKIIQYAVTEHGGTDSNAEDSLTEKHVVVTDEPVSIEWISRHPDTPKLNTEYRRHPGFWFDSITPKRTAKLVWEIDVHATTYQAQQIPESPLDEPARITLDSEVISEPTLFDHKGNPCTTTAGEWLAGITTERATWVYKVSKNVGSDPAWLDDYACAINSDAIRIRGRIRAAKTLMLRRLSMSEYQIKNRVSFSILSFELHFRPETWVQEKWNAGTLELFPTEIAGKKVWQQRPIMTTGEVPRRVENPVPLDRRGKIIPGVLDPSGEIPLDTSKLLKLKFQTQLEKPFRILPLN